jgi:lipid-binding SYLF domain-containing protein
VALLTAGGARADGGLEGRIREARLLVGELLLGADRVVPEALLADTRCLVAFPGVIEAALGLGGSHGVGVASCRLPGGGWSAPALLKVSGGSLGLQIGVRSLDLMFFVVSEEGARSLTGSSFAMGGEVSVAAGPIDRTAGVSTDQRFEEDIYLYARARGFFAGASIEGTRLRAAAKAISRYYGEPLAADELLFGKVAPPLPTEAEALLATLGRLASSAF